MGTRSIGKDGSYNSIKNRCHQALLEQQRQDEELLRGYYLTTNGSIASSYSKKSTSSSVRSRQLRKAGTGNRRSKSSDRRSKSPGKTRKSPYQRFTDDDYESDCEDAIETVLRERSTKKKKKQPSTDKRSAKKKKQQPNADTGSSSAHKTIRGESSKTTPPTVPQQQLQQEKEKPDQPQEAQEEHNNNNNNINGDSVFIQKSSVQNLLKSLVTERRKPSPAPATTTTTTTTSAPKTAINTDDKDTIVKRSLENILRSIDMDTSKGLTVDQERGGETPAFNDCASVSSSVMSSSSSVKSILKNGKPSSSQPPRTESAFRTKWATNANTKANAKTSATTAAAANNNDQSGDTTDESGGPSKKGLFGALLKRKAGRSNRVSACGSIETTIVYKKDPDNGSETAYEGKLRECPKSPDRVVLEIASMSNDDDDGVAQRNKNNSGSNAVDPEGREDIETGILRCNHQQEGMHSNGREEWNPPCGVIVTNWFEGTENGRRGRQARSGGDHNNLLDNFSCNKEHPDSKSTIGLNAMLPAKKVRFSFDEYSNCSNKSEGSGTSDRSTKRVKNKHRRKKSRKLQFAPARSRIPWPLTNASILDADSDETSVDNKPETTELAEARKKIVKACLIGISATFAVLIIGLAAGLTLYFIRAYRSEEGFWGGDRGGGGGGDEP